MNFAPSKTSHLHVPVVTPLKPSTPSYPATKVPVTILIIGYRLNGEQIIHFRPDIECVAVQEVGANNVLGGEIDATHPPSPSHENRGFREEGVAWGWVGANQASAASNTLEGI